MRAQHLSFAARNDVLGKIHAALADGSMRSDEAKALEEMAETLLESLGCRWLESAETNGLDGWLLRLRFR